MRSTASRLSSILTAILVVIVLGACHASSNAEGKYTVTFVWDGRLQEANVVRDGVDHRLVADVRAEVVKQAEPIIAEQLKRANLKKAQGVLKLMLLGTPPYAVFDSGVEITSPSISELIAAVDLEDIERIKALVSQYQNLNQRELPSQRTALFMAAAGSKVRSLQTLLDLGADPNIPDFEGDTALGIAVVADGAISVELLIHAGAKVDQANEQGITPLMKAAQLGRTSILELLLRSGANPDAKASNGDTALVLAREAKHKHKRFLS